MSPIVLGLVTVVLLNVLMFPLAFKLQTDKLTDITYCLSFACLAGYGIIAGDIWPSAPKLILAGLVLIWAIRLGAFLFHRVSVLGRDERFDEIRINKNRFFRFFLIQGVSAWIISLPFLYRLLQDPGAKVPLSDITTIEWTGMTVALIGLVIETVADQQKSSFKNEEGNGSKLYKSGLYSIVRYPNYLGEILFWVGIFIASLGAIYGIRWIAIVSPIIIVVLLLFVSGIPIIEKKRAEKHGSNKEYQTYVKNTKLIVPGVY